MQRDPHLKKKKLGVGLTPRISTNLDSYIILTKIQFNPKLFAYLIVKMKFHMLLRIYSVRQFLFVLN